MTEPQTPEITLDISQNPMANLDLPGMLDTQARRWGDKAFLIWSPFTGEEHTWSYRSFAAEVRRVAAGLAAKGIQAGDRVLIHLDNCPELLFVWFACATLGAVGVLSNTRSTGDDIAYFCELTETVGAVTQPAYAEKISEAAPALRFVVITESDAGDPAGQNLTLPRSLSFAPLLAAGSWDEVKNPDPTKDLSIQFTSGTTSRPKAVVWTHANVLFGAGQTARNYGLQAGDVCHITLPLYHVYALSDLMGSFFSGGSVLLQRKFSAHRFWEPALRHRATWAPMVVFCINALRKYPVPEHHFRFWQTGWVYPEIAQSFRVPSLGNWGMTEMGWLPIVSDPRYPGGPNSMGRPSPGIAVSIRRSDGSECAAEETGDLFIQGVPGLSIFRTYLKDPEAFAAGFNEGGWFRTGDRARRDAKGELYFADRSEDLIKVGGENVSATEIEQVILETGWIRECAVVAAPDPMLEEVPVAFVIPKENAPAPLKEKLIAHCRQRLAEFKRIREVHVVDDFPRSTVEKIAKNELREGLKQNLPGKESHS